MKIVLPVCFVLCLFQTKAQSPDVYPPHWWVDMKWNKVQLLVRSTQPDFNQADVRINYPGVTLDKIDRLENAHYYALDVTVAPGTKPGNVSIDFIRKGKTKSVTWVLKPRRPNKGKAFAQGIDAGDVIYLLMPDRFSNGDVTNDHVVGMRDQTLNRDSIYHRHGGDLQGVIDHLPYLKELGVTAIWLTPWYDNYDHLNEIELKEDKPSTGFHGYNPQDFYGVEEHFGTHAKLRELVETGEIAELRELEREVLPEIVGFGRLLGLSATRSVELARALGVETAAELGFDGELGDRPDRAS